MEGKTGGAQASSPCFRSPWGQPLTLDTLERKEELDRCEWSSHRDYAGWRQAAGWLSLEWLRFWGRSHWAAQRGYRQAMAAGFGRPVANPWEDLRGSLMLQ